MSVARYDLDACIGCMNCITICPMDVFRFDTENNKSIIAYVENCQTCGQCYFNCQGHSLAIDNAVTSYATANFRTVSTADPVDLAAFIIDTPARAAAEKEAKEAEAASESKS